MREVYLQLPVIQQTKVRKLRTVVTCDGLEHLAVPASKVLHDRRQRFLNRPSCVIPRLDPDTHSGHALYKRQHAGFGRVLFPDDRVNFPMAELRAELDYFIPVIDTSAKVALVFAHFCGLCVPAQFLGKIDVFDGQKPQIHVVVEGFGADHFLAAELSTFERISDAGIQRPMLIAAESFHDVLEELNRGKAAIPSTAVLAVLTVHLLATICVVNTSATVFELC